MSTKKMGWLPQPFTKSSSRLRELLNELSGLLTDLVDGNADRFALAISINGDKVLLHWFRVNNVDDADVGPHGESSHKEEDIVRLEGNLGEGVGETSVGDGKIEVEHGENPCGEVHDEAVVKEV